MPIDKQLVADALAERINAVEELHTLCYEAEKAAQVMALLSTGEFATWPTTRAWVALITEIHPHLAKR